MSLRVVVCGNQQGRLEDADLDRLDFDGWGEVRGEVAVHLFKGELQLPANGHPFRGSEVAVLEEEEQGRGTQQGGVLPVELRFAELGRFVRGRLGTRVAGDWGRGGGQLGEWSRGGGGGGGGKVLV